jgi:uncharacterized protein
MQDDVIAGVAANILLPECTTENILVAWHSGEPLALPPTYYRHAFELLSRNCPTSLRLHQHFQTNGTLITSDWVDFLLESQARICVSLDGPSEFHDRVRTRRTGKSTHHDTMRGISLLNEARIHPPIICVLTAEALQNPRLLFEFFEANEIYDIGFNVEETVGVHAALRCDNDAYCRFLNTYLNLVDRSGSAQRLRDIEQIAVRLFKNEVSPRSYGLISPFVHVSVDVAGNYWTYSPELGLGPGAARFFLGNCKTDRIADAAKTERFLKLHAEVEKGKHLCETTCSYFEVCGGGSPAHKFAEHGRCDETETHFCKMGIKSIVDVLTARCLATLQH